MSTERAPPKPRAGSSAAPPARPAPPRDLPALCCRVSGGFRNLRLQSTPSRYQANVREEPACKTLRRKPAGSETDTCSVPDTTAAARSSVRCRRLRAPGRPGTVPPRPPPASARGTARQGKPCACPGPVEGRHPAGRRPSATVLCARPRPHSRAGGGAGAVPPPGQGAAALLTLQQTGRWGRGRTESHVDVDGCPHSWTKGFMAQSGHCLACTASLGYDGPLLVALCLFPCKSYLNLLQVNLEL